MPTSAQASRACCQSLWLAFTVPLTKSAATNEHIKMVRDITVSNRRSVPARLCFLKPILTILSLVIILRYDADVESARSGRKPVFGARASLVLRQSRLV